MKRIYALVPLLMILFAFSVNPAVAVPPEPVQKPLPITIGYQANIDWLLLVAKELMLFEKAGLSTTFVKFVAGPPMIAAAQEKSIDVTSIGSVPYLTGLAQGVDWSVIGINPEGSYGEGLVARNGSGIETVADLAGKRIGVLKRSNAEYGLIMALYQLGIRRDQVTIVNIPPSEQLTALAKGEIDAAMVWEPWMQKMVNEADCRIIITEGEMGNYMGVSVYAARREWFRDNREAAVRFLRALLMANEIVQKDHTIAIKALAREMGISEAWAEIIYDNTPPPKISNWADQRYRYSLVKGAEFHRRLRYLARFLHDEKAISQKLDLRDVLDVSLITEALKTWKPGQ